MTKEALQKELEQHGIKAKVLYVRKTEIGDYSVFFTRDLSYQISEFELSQREYIEKPIEDVLVEDLEDAKIEIKLMLQKKAWYEEEIQ